MEEPILCLGELCYPVTSFTDLILFDTSYIRTPDSGGRDEGKAAEA